MIQRLTLQVDHDHVGRVLAERLRVGPGYLYDVRERVKRKRRMMKGPCR